MSSGNTLVDAVSTLPYSACPLEGVGTAGQPSESAWADLAKAGFKSVVDLRAPEEARGHDEASAVRTAGMEYIPLPVTPVTLRDESYDRFRKIMRDPARRPILVHCATANRVGALLIPYLMLDEGRPAEESIQVARQVGLRSPEYVTMALEYVNRHGARTRP
jgi:uncharacterized protein (TIGR01244 family)